MRQLIVSARQELLDVEPSSSTLQVHVKAVRLACAMIDPVPTVTPRVIIKPVGVQSRLLGAARINTFMLG